MNVGELTSRLVNVIASPRPEASIVDEAVTIASAIAHDVVGSAPGVTDTLRMMVSTMAANALVPPRIQSALQLIADYELRAINAGRPEIPSLSSAGVRSAIQQLANWYYLEHQKIEIPPAICAANNDYEPDRSNDSQVRDAEHTAIVARLHVPAPLRPYQWDGVTFLVRSTAGLLADEMGLGKTVQAVTALRIIFFGTTSRRAIIVTPAALVPNWERELSRWAPELAVRRVFGSSEDRRAAYRLPIQVLIATYEQVRIDAIDIPSDVTFEVAILDEAQRIKNRHSRAALACRFIRRSRSWALSGTPLENNLEDLCSIFLFLRPGLLDSGLPPRTMHARIQEHFLRRRKKEVLTEIPEIIFQDMPLELTGAQQAAYTQAWVDRREEARLNTQLSSTTLLALITELKQLCNYERVSGESVKLEALTAILEQCGGRDDKIIVFSQYVDSLKFVAERLGSFPYDLYIGSQNELENEWALVSFKENPGPRVLLVSLRAGGVGLNIPEASTVVLFDRWWNPAVENQAIQRAHRFGRTSALHVVRFIVLDTIEERIAEVLRHKQVDFDRYIENAGNASVSPLTQEDLQRILAIPIEHQTS